MRNKILTLGGEHDHYRQKYLPYMAIISMMLMSCCGVLGGKLIETSFGTISAASLVSPFWFILGDVITEVYGYRNSINLYKAVILCQFTFAVICYFLIKLPSPDGWQGQLGYELALGNLVPMAICQFIGMSVAWPLNAYLLSKWKILTDGKYFWLRSIGSSGIGEIIFTVVSVSLSIYGVFPIHQLITIVTISCVLKVVFNIIFAYPSTILVVLLNYLESRKVVKE